MSEARDEHEENRLELLWKLILMRETGPKSRAWHAARMRMIWRLHAEMESREIVARAAEEGGTVRDT